MVKGKLLIINKKRYNMRTMISRVKPKQQLVVEECKTFVKCFFSDNTIYCFVFF